MLPPALEEEASRTTVHVKTSPQQGMPMLGLHTRSVMIPQTSHSEGCKQTQLQTNWSFEQVIISVTF